MKNSHAGSGSSILNYLTNKYSREELYEVLEFFKEPSKEDHLNNSCRDIWDHEMHTLEVSEAEKSTDYDSILERIHQRIHIYYDQAESGSRRNRLMTHHRFRNIFYKAAAILLLPLIFTSVFLHMRDKMSYTAGQETFTEIHTPAGSKLHINMPDGSEAWLNSGTLLRYSNDFGENSRRLFITGEAYFSVIENSSKPFIVEAEELEVRVTGTCFNVMSYKDDDDIEITLEEGSLELFRINNDRSAVQFTSMDPGDHVRFDLNSNSYSRTSGETDLYSSWKEHLLILRDDPMTSVIKKLERWFNVEIVLADQDLADILFTATFSDETLFQVLELLSYAAPIDYQISSPYQKSDHTFAKRRVTISYKPRK